MAVDLQFLAGLYGCYPSPSLDSEGKIQNIMVENMGPETSGILNSLATRRGKAGIDAAKEGVRGFFQRSYAARDLRQPTVMDTARVSGVPHAARSALANRQWTPSRS